MSINVKTVEYIASLSSIKLSDQQKQKMVTDLSETLEFVSQLNAVDTEGVSPTSHVHGAINAFRKDSVEESFTLEQLELNAPDFAGSSFRVPKVI